MSLDATGTADPATIELERLAAAFIHTLRSGGITVPISATIRYVEALRAVGLHNGEDVYWACLLYTSPSPRDRG